MVLIQKVMHNKYSLITLLLQKTAVSERLVEMKH